MGNDKVAIRQNVLDGDNLPNAILNAVIAGFDVATVVNDTVEVLQQGETTTYMFEATPDAIEHFAETFLANVRLVADELRGYEYIDKPVIRRLDGADGADGTIVRPEADAGQEAETADAEDGIEVESADEPAAAPVDELDLDDVDTGRGGGEQTIRKVGVDDLRIKALLKHQRPAGDGRFEGKVVILFPNDLGSLGHSVASVISKQGVDDAELAQAVEEYVLEFIGRTADKYFGGMAPDAAEATLEFTGMAFSTSNERALVSTFEVGGAG